MPSCWQINVKTRGKTPQTPATMGASILIKNSGWKASNPRPTNRHPVLHCKLPVLKRQKNMGKCTKFSSNICQVTTLYDLWNRKYCPDKMYLPSLLFVVFIAGAVVAYLSFTTPYGLLSFFSTKQIESNSHGQGPHDTSLVFRVRQQQMPVTEGLMSDLLFLLKPSI